MEFVRSIPCPGRIQYKCKQVGLVDIDYNATVQEIDSIDYLYETISVFLKNAKMLYDNQYVFNHDKVASINSFMVYFHDSANNYTLNEVHKYANYFINWFPNIKKVYLRGNAWDLDHLFSIMIQPRITKKINFELFKSIDEELRSLGITRFKLPNMQLSYYNSTSKTVTIIDAYNIHLQFLNNDWNQINGFVFVKNLKFLDIGCLHVKEDGKTIKAIKDTINNCNLNDQSFLAIKTKIKIMNSLRSK